MQKDFDPQASSNNNPPYLWITDADSKTTATELVSNNSLFAGSSSNCKILLKGSGVQSIHCMLWLDEQKQLRIQDWNTGGKTEVNGNVVTEELVLHSGDEICIGDNRILAVLTFDVHVRVAGQQGSEESTEQLAQPEPKSVSELAQDESSKTDQWEIPSFDHEVSEPTAFDRKTLSDTEKVPELELSTQNVSTPDASSGFDESEIKQPLYESGYSESEYEDPQNNEPAPNETDADSQPQETLNQDPDADFVYSLDFDESEDCDFGRSTPGSDSLSSEEAESLKMEVDQLRFELAERDSQIQMLNQSNQDNCSEYEDNEETVKLVARLEELLAELRTSDDRVRELEELLRVSDQATQAEQEERMQLESWVTEIEQRVAQRESESEAEMTRLKKHIKELKSHYKQSEQQLQKVVQTNEGKVSVPAVEDLKKLSQQVIELQSRLQSATEENEQLRKHHESNKDSSNAETELKLTQEKLMKLQVESSQERAELARQRAQLERLKDELEQKLNSSQKIGDADKRILAMRKHLQDIHEAEKQEREVQKQRSLSGRISRLLNRVGK